MGKDNVVQYYVRVDDKYIPADMDNAEKKIKSGGSKIASTLSKLAIGAAFIKAGKDSVQMGMQFEQSMANASTLFGNTSVDTKKLSSEMLDLSSATGIAAEELGDSLYNALSAGVPVTEDMGEATAYLEKSAKLAKAGFTDIDTASNATISTINAYGMSIKDADKVQKILMQTQNKGKTTIGELGSALSNVTPTAAAMNVSFEQVGAALSNMTAKGVPTAKSTTQLNQLFAELGKKGTKAQEALEEATKGTKYAGKGFADLMKEGVPLNEVLDLMGKYAKKNDLKLIDLFGSLEAGQAAMNNSGANAQGFTDALAAMGTQTDVVNEAYEKVSSTTGEQFNRALNDMKVLLIDIYQNVLQPLVINLMDMYKWIVANAEYLPYVAGVIGTITALIIAYNIQQAIASAEAGIWAFVAGNAAFSTTALGAAFTFLTSPIGLIILAIAAVIAIGVALYKNWDTVSKFLMDTWKKISEYFKNLFDPLIKWFKDTWNKALEWFKELWSGIKKWFFNTINNIRSDFKRVFTNMREFFLGIWKVISGVFNSYIESMIGVFNGFKSSVNEIINGLKRTFNGLIKFIKGVFTGDWRSALEGLKDIFGGAFQSLVGLMKSPINAIVGGINRFISGLNRIQIPDWVPGIGGKGINIPKIPRLKVGMDYVPSDEFPAFLHEGEAVLTKAEAQRWRAGLPRFSRPNPGPPTTNVGQNSYKFYLTANLEADGYPFAKVVMQNIDDVRSLG